MIHQIKEEPNTKNIIIWPENIRNEEKLNNKIKLNLNKENNKIKLNYYNNERIEYYIFIIFGSLIWLVIAHTILKWHQFPIHKHPYESFFIYIFPIFVIIFVLFLLDFGISKSNIKKDN